MSKKKHSTWEILFGELIVPRYVPFAKRVFLLLNKLQRSFTRRYLTRSTESSVVADEPVQSKTVQVGSGNGGTAQINKTVMDIDADLERPEFKKISKDLDALKQQLNDAGLRFTNFAGNFKQKDYVPNKERNKLWENISVLHAARCASEDVILDVGGASTLFSFYLASLGCDVSIIDNDWGNNGIVANAAYVGNAMKWKMHVLHQNVSNDLPFKRETFDKVFCVCVLEHLTSDVRQKLMREINRVLKPGGLVSLTIDYDFGRDINGFDKGLRYSFRDRLLTDIIEPSGMRLYGNATLLDDCPDDFFLGTLFLQKEQTFAP